MLNTIVGSGTQTVYLQVHTGDPGTSGTANVGDGGTRASATIALVVDGGSGTSTRTSNGDGAFGAVSDSTTYTHLSVWSAASSGTCYMYGAMTASVQITAGNTFTVPSGSLVLSLT
jgi:hypothetical protein